MNDYTTVDRLTAMFRAVSDPATKQDCATLTIDAEPGDVCVEYGAFRDGDVLNIPTVGHEQDTSDIFPRVDRAPTDHTAGTYIVYDVDDMSEREAAEFLLDAIGGWSGFQLVKANLRTIETGGIAGWLMNWMKDKGVA